MKDQMKQTTFCAKLRNARCSNRRASGPNRFVDLRTKSTKLIPASLRVGVQTAFWRGRLQSFLEDALVDVGGPDPGDAEGEDGHAPRHAPAAAVAAVAGSGADDAVDAAAAAAPARGCHGVGSPDGDGKGSVESRRMVGPMRGGRRG
jgi:hypothetical protein